MAATTPAEDGEGVLVKQVSAEGVAAMQGLKVGDQIVSVNGTPSSRFVGLGTSDDRVAQRRRSQHATKEINELMQFNLAD